MHLAVFTFAMAATVCAIESLIGYPAPIFARIGHPVTWMGHLIAALDRHLNRESDPPILRKIAGGGAVLILLFVTALCVEAVSAAIVGLVGPGVISFLILALCTSSCLAQRSLAKHVHDVAQALEEAGLEKAREAVGHIVGRNVETLDRAGIARAAIESLAENFSDGIIAPAFWIAALGPLGGFLYKAINTADSMIGHRTKRHAAFGFVAAKLDDLVNLAPARLSALWI